jgi:hypothetical protein
MVNLEYKLTVDDLIVEYMMKKIKDGYNPSYTVSEFIDFLHFFESKMEVEDSIYDGKQLFERFFERKSKSDWYSEPHMEMTYSQDDNDYIIKANEKFSCYDASVINTYFMDNGMGRYDNYKGKTYQIRSIIGEWLSKQSKRELNDNMDVSDKELLTGKYVTIEIINNIWESYVDNHIKNNSWPRQCKDINKYLFEMDLANIINVKSIKNKLLELYRVFPKRIAIMYHENNKLKISTCSGNFLAIANYNLLIKDYEDIMGIAFGNYKKSLTIDLENSFFIESHEIDGIYNWDEEVDIKTTKSSIENENVKKLVKSIDSTINN